MLSSSVNDSSWFLPDSGKWSYLTPREKLVQLSLPNSNSFALPHVQNNCFSLPKRVSYGPLLQLTLECKSSQGFFFLTWYLATLNLLKTSSPTQMNVAIILLLSCTLNISLISVWRTPLHGNPTWLNIFWL